MSESQQNADWSWFHSVGTVHDVSNKMTTNPLTKLWQAVVQPCPTNVGNVWFAFLLVSECHRRMQIGHGSISSPGNLPPVNPENKLAMFDLVLLSS